MSRSGAVEEVLQALRENQVPDISGDLPVPLTTRNLQPRAMSRSSGHSEARSASGSRPPSRASASQSSRGNSFPMHEGSTFPGSSQNFHTRAYAASYNDYEAPDADMYPEDDFSHTIDDYNLGSSWSNFESPWFGDFRGQNEENEPNDMYNPTQSSGSWNNSTSGIQRDVASGGPSGSKRKRSPSPTHYASGPSQISQLTDSDAEVVDHLIDGDSVSFQGQPKVDLKGKGKAREETSPAIEISDSPPSAMKEPKKSEPEPLSEYTCPICFGPPMNATLTPCGHISCGSCLFAAVKSTLQRATVTAPGVNEARLV